MSGTQHWENDTCIFKALLGDILAIKVRLGAGENQRENKSILKLLSAAFLINQKILIPLLVVISCHIIIHIILQAVFTVLNTACCALY